MRRPHRLRAGTKNLAPKNLKGKIWDYRTTDYKTATESIGKSAGRQIGRSGRQRIANGNWRVVNSEWRFLEGTAHALPKIFGTSGDVPSFRCSPFRS
jgi:hypothetical protein